MFEFGIRRIMRMNYTRYISLPPAWIDSQMKEGNRIRITMDDARRLILEPVKDEIPAAGADIGVTAPGADDHRTHEGADADGIEH